MFGIKNKKELREWQKQEKIKLKAITIAFSTRIDNENESENNIELACQEMTEGGQDGRDKNN